MTFRACERFGIRPWEFGELGLQQRLDLMCYDRLATHDEDEFRLQLAQLGVPH